MDKKILALLVFLPVIAHAQMKDYSSNTLKIVEDYPADAPPLTAAMKKQVILHKQQLKTKGYVEHDLSTPKIMLDMVKRGVNFNASNNPEDTRLKKNISDIKLAFSYTPKTSHPLGFAPIMAYVKNGWTGVKEFFKEDNIGVCSLWTYNLGLSNGKAYLIKGTFTDDINGKPTTTYVEGSMNTGFLYSISWEDGMYSKYLQCANMNYNKEITQKMIALAKELDKK